MPACLPCRDLPSLLAGWRLCCTCAAPLLARWRKQESAAWQGLAVAVVPHLALVPTLPQTFSVDPALTCLQLLFFSYFSCVQTWSKRGC